MPLLLLQHQHEVVLEAALHHHPVHGPRQVDVRCQEHNVLPMEHGDRLVRRLEVVQHRLEGTVPLARRARAGAGVGSIFAELLMGPLFGVQQANLAAKLDKLAWESDCFGDLLHRKVPHTAQPTPTAGTKIDLGSTVRADEVATVALVDWREDIVKADRALKQASQISR